MGFEHQWSSTKPSHYTDHAIPAQTNLGWKEKNESYYASTISHFMYEIFFSDEFNKCCNNGQLQYSCAAIIKKSNWIVRWSAAWILIKKNSASDTSCVCLHPHDDDDVNNDVEAADGDRICLQDNVPQINITRLITHKFNHVIHLFLLFYRTHPFCMANKRIFFFVCD